MKDVEICWNCQLPWHLKAAGYKRLLIDSETLRMIVKHRMYLTWYRDGTWGASDFSQMRIHQSKSIHTAVRRAAKEKP